MKFTLSKPLNFILKPGLTTGYIEMVNGCHCITSGDFRQFIKASEYSQIVESSVAPADNAVIEEPVKAEEPKSDVLTDEPKEPRGRGTRRK